MLYATEKHRAVTEILLVFMFIFAELLVAENDFSEMDDSQLQLKTVTQSSVIAETYISSQNPSLNYLSASENRIGVDGTGDESLHAAHRFFQTGHFLLSRPAFVRFGHDAGNQRCGARRG